MGGSEGESRVPAVVSDASSMISPELAERSSRKKCDGQSIRWIAFPREVAPSKPRPNVTRDPNRTSDQTVPRQNRFGTRASLVKMRQKFDVSSG
jgi:hypothetical protein